MDTWILTAACSFPSGPTIQLADAAVRAQVCLPRRHPHYRDACGHPISVSMFPLGVEAPCGSARTLALVRSVLEPIAPRFATGQPVALWLVVPHPRQRAGVRISDEAALLAHLQTTYAPLTVRRVRGGHVAGLLAVQAAQAWLSDQPRGCAVILSVESVTDADALLWLEVQGLLHGSRLPHHGATRANPYGRTPGEGAAALVLTAQPERGGAPWAKLIGIGLTQETASADSGAVCTGEALSAAARQAMTQAQQTHSPRIGRVTTDLNGEPYRADEYGFTISRLRKCLAPEWTRITPVLASGDLHSASALTHLALAAFAQYARPHDTAPELVLASSDGSARGAAIVTSAQGTIPG